MRTCLAALCLTLLCADALALAAPLEPDPSYVDELIAEARARQLSRDVQWLRLGHWRTRWLGGYESEADGPAFFLAPGGKRDPQAELDATLRAFFAADPAEPGTPALRAGPSTRSAGSRRGTRSSRGPSRSTCAGCRRATARRSRPSGSGCRPARSSWSSRPTT